MRILLIISLLAGALSGCAKLHVTKIMTQNSGCKGDQNVKGFRYYLSRPYVVVANPVLVSEVSSLYLAPPEQIAVSPKTMKLNKETGAFERISDAELTTIRGAIKSQHKVQPVGHHRQIETATTQPEPLTPINVQAAQISAETNPDDAIYGSQTTAESNVSLADAGTSGGSPLGIPTIAVKAAHATGVSGDIKVVYLPDLDEQYAVHNRNVLSKSAYSLNFRDGWELTDVGGEFDSTAVPLEILNFIDKAISAAKTVAAADTNRMANAVGNSRADGSSNPGRGVIQEGTLYRVVTSTYVQPGIYRINKPWEVAQETEPCGAGFLVKMGMATYETTRIEPYRTSQSLAALPTDN